MEAESYDVVIIGSGLGGLMSGFILAEEGYNVCVLEKNRQIGGNLQTFVRDKALFDTGVHYIGGLEKGQALYQYFKYFQLIDKLKLKRLDEDGFEHIYIGSNPVPYKYGMGYDTFKANLKKDFPGEEKAIDDYCEKMQFICNSFPMYNLELEGEAMIGQEILYISAKKYFEELTSNVRLQNVLAATNILYAGDQDVTPLYVHALVVNSYIISSYRIIGGSSQIASILTKHIRSKGGKVKSHAEVVKLEMDSADENVEFVVLSSGQKIKAKTFIASNHPAMLMELINSDKLRKAYRNRIVNLENTESVFILYVVPKKDAFPYLNYNVYSYNGDDVWTTSAYNQENWPLSFALFTAASPKSEEFCDAISIMAYMHMADVKEWESTFSIVSREADRGETYNKFKIDKAEKLLDLVVTRFPNFRDCIQSYSVATPLTYRDYIGTKDGSVYGIKKDYHDPLRTYISHKTRIPNLLITGQNLHMHGVYGVTVGAVKTVGEIIGEEYLVNKIKKS